MATRFVTISLVTKCAGNAARDVTKVTKCAVVTKRAATSTPVAFSACSLEPR